MLYSGITVSHHLTNIFISLTRFSVVEFINAPSSSLLKMNLLESKLLTMSVLGVVSIFLGLLPVLIVRKLRLTPSLTGDVMSPFTRTVVSGILCFGGGVLMGTVRKIVIFRYIKNEY